MCLVWSPSHWLRYQLLCEISPVAWMKWRMAPSLGLCISGSICWWLKERFSHTALCNLLSVRPQHSPRLTDFDPEAKTSWSPTWTEWSSATWSWRCSPSQSALGFHQVSVEILKTESVFVRSAVCRVFLVYVYMRLQGCTDSLTVCLIFTLRLFVIWSLPQ